MTLLRHAAALAGVVLFALGLAVDRSVFVDARDEEPGRVHHIQVADLPPPHATSSSDNGPEVVARPRDAWPRAPQGLAVTQYVTGLDNPRLIRTAPNGDVFVAESAAGRVRVLRGLDANGRAATSSVYATGLQQPFGIAFYPPGTNPQWVYVANTDSVVRFAYRESDLQARGAPEKIADVPGGGRLRGGGHWTRDIAFSLDGRTMYVSVGSHSNDSDPDTDRAEFRRADILAFDPQGRNERVFASGLRNAVGIAIDPTTGGLWASVNERDGLGDDLPPDYITRVREGGFYGWPWFYTGGHQDPNHLGKHVDLKDKVITPDVLLQPHSASLEMTFDDRRTPAGPPALPDRYIGGVFAAEHGSWNRSRRTGYEVIFVPIHGGKATGEYEDFLTGFVDPAGRVWGRPVGVTLAGDGSLLVSDDGSDTIWRVARTATATR